MLRDDYREASLVPSNMADADSVLSVGQIVGRTRVLIFDLIRSCKIDYAVESRLPTAVPCIFASYAATKYGLTVNTAIWRRP